MIAAIPSDTELQVHPYPLFGEPLTAFFPVFFVNRDSNLKTCSSVI